MLGWKPRWKPAVNQRGQSAVEFALIMPFLLLLVAMLVDFGLAFYNFMNVVNVAREGARFAVVCQSTTSIESRVISGAPASMGLTSGNIDISSPDGADWEIGEAITVTVSYNYTTVTPLTNLVNLAASGLSEGGPLTFELINAASFRVERVSSSC